MRRLSLRFYSAFAVACGEANEASGLKSSLSNVSNAAGGDVSTTPSTAVGVVEDAFLRFFLAADLSPPSLPLPPAAVAAAVAVASEELDLRRFFVLAASSPGVAEDDEGRLANAPEEADADPPLLLPPPGVPSDGRK